MLIGVDIGTLRLRINQVVAEPLHIDTSGEYSTQSLVAVWDLIVKWLPQLDLRPTNAIAITATCLLVVLEVATVSGHRVLRPFNCLADPDRYVASDDHDVWMWNDQRALRQANRLTDALKGTPWLQQLGGRITPEMGVAKLKWLSDNYRHRQLMVFEYYDWIQYLLLHGGYQRDSDGHVYFGYHPVTTHFPRNGAAIDGSVKGWGADAWSRFGIGSHVTIGCSNSDGKMLALGVPIGDVHPTILLLTDAQLMVVAQGAIDAYAAWLLIYTPDSNVVAMIAGTLTCFFVADRRRRPLPIPGIWGPYDVVGDDDIHVYEFGQLVTGRLFERLIVDLCNLHGDVLYEDPFHFLEHKTEELEQLYNHHITEIIKPYLYYGDLLGNRSPYNLSTMSEMVIDGHNSRPDLASALETLVELMVVRYNLTMEHLAFQTRQMIECYCQGAETSVAGIVVVGSQAQNDRLLQLIANVTGLKVLRAETLVGEFGGAIGANIMAKVARRLVGVRATKAAYADALAQLMDTGRRYREFVAHPNKTLDLKYRFYCKFADLQHQFKQAMG